MSELISSFTTAKISNLDNIGSVNSTFSLKFFWASYLPLTGFAAAITLHLAFSNYKSQKNTCKEVTIPALEIDILCCSIAS